MPLAAKTASCLSGALALHLLDLRSCIPSTWDITSSLHRGNCIADSCRLLQDKTLFVSCPGWLVRDPSQISVGV
ncbi:unnamed protein product [Pleuronectes platessa]|uniref:Secreted protein n=1 Tax=Pleuronectes platessa TaxID=8262 RepID=A0A9N7V1G9_PLEPL|nr:unnamed protein product [Pleuronectes platessa]